MRYFNWSELVKNYEKPHANGAESIYWKVDEDKGLKVLRTPFRLPNGEGYALHANQEALELSSKWREAQRQFDLMVILAARKRCPKPFELAVICDDRAAATGVGYLFYPAILMEHVQYTAYSYQSRKKGYKAFYKFVELMNKIVTLCDNHGDNVIFNEKLKRFQLLDLGGVDKK